MTPSQSGEPALTKSFSCTNICFDNGTKYFLICSSLEVIIISLLPLLILGPKDTIPSISETIAGFEGFLASNNCVTLGRPPVISPEEPIVLGILQRIVPFLIF